MSVYLFLDFHFPFHPYLLALLLVLLLSVQKTILSSFVPACLLQFSQEFRLVKQINPNKVQTQKSLRSHFWSLSFFSNDASAPASVDYEAC